jgi:hypothetical protein
MRRFHLALGLVAIFALPSVVAQSDTLTAVQRAEGEAIVQLAAKYLAANLRDPSVALFRNVFIRKRMNKDGKIGILVCGEINAKNGYGGFTGFETFIYAADRVYVGQVFSVSAAELCARNNPTIDTRDYAPEMKEAYSAAVGG